MVANKPMESTIRRHSHQWSTGSLSDLLTLVLSLIYQWKTRQIDFVLAFPQADVECELYMELPRGLIIEGCHRDTHCVKLLKNLYG
jgi:hypothetical protein